MAVNEALVTRLQSGDAAAFEEVVRTFGGAMRAAALRLLRDESDADDAVQDAFVSALRAIGEFEGRAQLGTWLHRITINASLMKLRARERSPEADVAELLPEFLESGVFATPQAPWHEPADAPAIRADLAQQLHALIDELPEKFRTPLLLRDIEGMSNDDIADGLGVSVNAVKVRTHRARQALRTLLERRLADFE